MERILPKNNRRKITIIGYQATHRGGDAARTIALKKVYSKYRIIMEG